MAKILKINDPALDPDRLNLIKISNDATELRVLIKILCDKVDADPEAKDRNEFWNDLVKRIDQKLSAGYEADNQLAQEFRDIVSE